MSKRKDGLSLVAERLGVRLAALRELRGWTQEQMAERVGVGPSHIAKIEIGIRRPSLELMYHFSKALKVEIKDLFDFDETREWQGPIWEGEALRLRQLVEGQPEEDVKLLYMLAKKIWTR